MLLISVTHRLSVTVWMSVDLQRLDIYLHACEHLKYGLVNHGLLFSLVLVYFTLISYVYNYARWQGRTPPA